MDKKRREAHAAYMREWREKHPENAEYQREYQKRYLSDPARREAARERARKWAADNRERSREKAKAHYYANRQLKGRPTGPANWIWRGDAVGYHALHVWLARVLGKPSRCEHCGTTTAKRFEWANKDHKYRRDAADWMRLCTSCHRQYDYATGIAKKGGPRGPRKKSG